MNYITVTVYSTATGEIDRTVECDENILPLQIQDGESYVYGAISAKTHYIVNGAAVAKGVKASDVEVWDETTKAWIDPRTFDEIKLTKWTEIRTYRNWLETQGFPYLNRRFDSDPRSVQRINTAVQAAQAALSAGQPFQIEWTAQDNTAVALDAVAMVGMPAALAMYANSLHEHAKGLRAMIENAATVEEVTAIDWSTEPA